MKHLPPIKVQRPSKLPSTEIHDRDKPDAPDEILDMVSGPFERALGRARPR